MPYKSLVYERLHLVRWDNPTSHDVERVFAEVKALHGQRRCPLILIAIVPPDTSPPDGDTRKVMTQQLTPMLEWSESLHFIMEGTGFKNSILRSATTNVVMLAGKKGKITIYKTTEEAFAALEPRLRELKISPAALRQASLNKGILRVGGERVAQPA